jgi:hypothetical protein
MRGCRHVGESEHLERLWRCVEAADQAQTGGGTEAESRVVSGVAEDHDEICTRRAAGLEARIDERCPNPAIAVRLIDGQRGEAEREPHPLNPRMERHLAERVSKIVRAF